MELRQLKYFATVAKTLNFSQAAKMLYITQGTLSQQIKQLEDELDVQLFSRTSHNVTLTEAGEHILPAAVATLDASRECREKINDLKRTLCGTLNIGLTKSFQQLFTDTVREFTKKYPRVCLNIQYRTASDLLEMLADGSVDFVLAFKPANLQDGIETEVLFESHLSAVVHRDHPLADEKSITLEQLKGHRVILPARGLQTRTAFERFVDINFSELNVAVEINEPNITIEMLHNSSFVGIMSSLATCYDPSLVAIPLVDAPRKMLGCVHWLKDSYRKRSAEIFLEMLRDSAQINNIIANFG